MHRSAGLIQDWPGAHSTWISMSRSSCLKAVMFPNFTVSIVFLWSVPPSVYFRRTLGTQSPWNLFLVAAGSLIGELQSFNMTNIFPVVTYKWIQVHSVWNKSMWSGGICSCHSQKLPKWFQLVLWTFFHIHIVVIVLINVVKSQLSVVSVFHTAQQTLE